MAIRSSSSGPARLRWRFPGRRSGSRRRVSGGGGALSLEDLAGYEVIEREPVSVEYRGHEFRSNPPPSSGGVLIALGLLSLGDRDPTPVAIADAMEAQEATRNAAFARALHSGDAA